MCVGLVWLMRLVGLLVGNVIFKLCFGVLFKKAN